MREMVKTISPRCWRPLLFSRGPKAQGKIVAVSRALRGNRFNHPPDIEQSIFVLGLYHDITWFLFLPCNSIQIMNVYECNGTNIFMR